MSSIHKNMHIWKKKGWINCSEQSLLLEMKLLEKVNREFLAFTATFLVWEIHSLKS